ncbi:DUF4396 domain-containing protein [Hymenobacter sp. UV11]|uniref:DUF4396 domain-containing protein n=1 Tax=Hymenobacter sp. UV11 TaxID=1849735 RepID=UPI0010621278|nr:DUF4396 domain-containing protein [Hymenobacter sp. UV11]TDN36212.1 hypothetical protein A8B98_09800 [Hymenobacter sp. UV11]TFZ66913.1 DUF4396 domain-containing protein [Hymenobacter sp. UV11]
MLHTVAVVSLVVALLCVVLVALDIVAGHRQKMWIMNAVWILTPLYAGPLGLWAYYKLGRLSTQKKAMAAKEAGTEPPSQQKPFWQSVAVGVLHCGSGCSLGDLLVETFVLYVPFVVLGHAIFGAWILDYIVAFLFGIAFQYFTIKPMKNLSPAEGLKAAVKADALSLTAWQVGMYGWMAIATFVIFKHELKANNPVFWFMMQLAMLAGFLTAYPVNWWLIKSGVKEEM